MEPTPTPISSDDKPSQLSELLRDELRLILDEPLTPKTCNRLVRVAAAAKAMLRAVSNTPAARKRHGGIMLDPSPGYDDNSYQVDDDDPPLGGTISIEGGPNQETMGVSIIKEVVGMLKGVDRTRIDQLITAYESAKDAGLDDVAEQLKRKIEVKVEDTPSAPSQQLPRVIDATTPASTEVTES